MDIEDWAYPPNGGKVKMVLLGVVLPLVIAYIAARAWITEETIWPGRRGSITVRYETARALAVCYLSVASFAHFRWFWGLLPEERVFKAGIVASMIVGLLALLTAAVLAFG